MADKPSISVGGANYTVCFFVSANIPSIYVQTESGSLNAIHANKEPRKRLSSPPLKVVRLHSTALNSSRSKVVETIHREPPKAVQYQIRQKNRAARAVESKKWLLLASYNDWALLRNAIAFELAGRLGLPYTSEYRLYINDEYHGNYLGCESVEVGDNHVKIPDYDDANEVANAGINLKTLPRGSVGGNAPRQLQMVRTSQ